MPPVTIADKGLTNPAAGVTATSPTTIPVAAPTAVAFPVRLRSRRLHTTSAAIGANIVLANASAANGVAASALPALQPNQPNHTIAVPSSVQGTLCGTIACRA